MEKIRKALNMKRTDSSSQRGSVGRGKGKERVSYANPKLLTRFSATAEFTMVIVQSLITVIVSGLNCC